MPRSAKIAVGMLVAVLAVGLVRTLTAPPPDDPRVPAWFAAVVGSVTLVILAALVAAIATGRRWALVVSIVVLVAGLPLAHLTPSAGGNRGWLVSSAQILASGVAYVLLWTRSSREWFGAARGFRRGK
jgi:hypothetical protein